MEGKVSVIDTTQQLEWEVTKEAYDNCAFPQRLTSPVFKIQVGKEESRWQMKLLPKGGENKQTLFRLELLPSNIKYFVNWNLAVKNSDGKFHADVVEMLYANSNSLNNVKYTGKSFDGNSDAKNRRVTLAYRNNDVKFPLSDGSQDMITLVVTLVIYVEGEKYIPQRDMATNFVDGRRSISDLDMFSDFTIICGGKHFKCHRNILASMSTTFKTMLTNDSFVESKELVVEIFDSTPKIVEAMLYFINNGIIPANIHAIAFDLIHLAQKYDLQDLLKACERSLANNMTVENVIDTLITLDLYVPTSEFRQKIIEFIKSNGKEVIKVKDWTKFVQNYPNLVTEVFLSFVNQS